MTERRQTEHPAVMLERLLREKHNLILENEQLRALLIELIDIEGPQPGTGDWYEKVRAVLDKAGGNGGD